MSEAHTDHEATVENAAKTLGDLTILNCTKVVRIFVMDAGKTIEKIRANESTTRADVFAVQDKDATESAQSSSKSGGGLKPMSIGLSAVVDHHTAHHQHPGGIVVLKRSDGDQIEWQCDVPFRVVNITFATHAVGLRFKTFGNPPKYPFTGSLDELKLRKGDRCTPIRSGAIRQHEHGLWKQLYKAHFELQIGGAWQPFDPDFYCEGHP